MSILSISPTHFRNLRNHEPISFHSTLNIVIGENASGKTSLLEAIYLLSTGKSFRTRLIDNIINSDSSSDHFVLFGRLHNNSDGREDSTPHSVGIKRSKTDKSLIKIDEEIVPSASTLALLSPTLVIQPSSFELLDGSPKVRRRFLDWGVFHVEHSFSLIWKEYISCLKQRNTLLRNARIDDLQLRIWDERLATIGESINALREQFVERYNECLSKYISQFNLPSELVVRYYRGWDKTKGFGEILNQYRAKDIERKYTQFGPQRADIKIILNGKTAEQILSRGQQKLLVLAMHLVHIELVNLLTQKQSVTLIDDVAAELDQKNLGLIFDCLFSSNTQVICTGIDKDRIQSLIASSESYKMFHVEHGRVNEITEEKLETKNY